MSQYVLLFEAGDKGMKALLGGKGANLAEMSRLGLPVPPGFTITTEACMKYLTSDFQLPDGMRSQVESALTQLEAKTGKGFGDPASPLLLSVRSGAAISMPGMMETILNLGMNDDTVAAMAQLTGDARFAWDSYRRLISMLGEVVFGIPKDAFEDRLTERKRQKGVEQDVELTAEDWQALVAEYKDIFRQEAKVPFPQDPMAQLWLAIEAVFKSWNIPRAVAYRKHHRIPNDLGTAVNIQTMVFGNRGEDSATGVAFTRNPATGERQLYGEFLPNAQGEDVVAGIRTPYKIAEMKARFPKAYQALEDVARTLERHYKDAQDIEFTIEQQTLYMLQTRSAKRTAQAAVKIAVDLVEEGLITQDEALLMVDANQLPQTLLPRFTHDQAIRRQFPVLAVGLGASPGAASGQVVFDPDEAEAWAHDGKDVILVRPETVPDDIHGMIAARGILTTRGGTTSHAAVVARGMGKPCITGCEACHIDLKDETLIVKDTMVRKGDVISIDGATGEVFLGQLPTEPPQLLEALDRLLAWSDDYRNIIVRANADTPADAAKARQLGAKGIGLCRTEHMFMGQDRLPVMQQMILADTPEARRECLERLLPMQLADFEGIFEAMDGLPVTIRLLDPPLHEFLPNADELIEELAVMRATRPDDPERPVKEKLWQKVRQLRESNPMLGFRGCRLGLLYPEINEMQVKAIFQAAANVMARGIRVLPEVMIPLVGTAEELRRLREQLETLARAVMAQNDVMIPYQFGTMIEVPRAALVADQIAEHAEFFSFGTNDLTQMTFGYSRDDAEGRFLSAYLDKHILPLNPFEVLDTDGVGQLILMTRDKARQVRPEIKLGICGEHGGDAQSVAFCCDAGLNYVSCSPFRVPVARVAGAQAAIRRAHGSSEQRQRDVVSA